MEMSTELTTEPLQKTEPTLLELAPTQLNLTLPLVCCEGWARWRGGSFPGGVLEVSWMCPGGLVVSWPGGVLVVSWCPGGVLIIAIIAHWPFIINL
jgi:hypothetical protein